MGLFLPFENSHDLALAITTVPTRIEARNEFPSFPAKIIQNLIESRHVESWPSFPELPEGRIVQVIYTDLDGSVFPLHRRIIVAFHEGSQS